MKNSKGVNNNDNNKVYMGFTQAFKNDITIKEVVSHTKYTGTGLVYQT